MELKEIHGNSIQSSCNVVGGSGDQIISTSSDVYRIGETFIGKFFLDEAESKFDYSDLVENEVLIAQKILSIYIFGQRPIEVVRHIQESLINLTEQERFKILKYIAIHDGRRATEYFDLFGITNEDNTCHIVKICAIKHARRTCKHIQLFCVKSEHIRYELAMICCLSNAPSVLEYIANFGITEKKYLLNILSKALLINPGSIKFIGNIGTFIDFGNIKDIGDINSLNDWVNHVSSLESDYQPISINAKDLFKRVPRRDMGIRVLAGYVLGGKLIKNDYNSIGVITGLSIDKFQLEKASDTTRNDLLDKILDLQSRYNTPIGSWINFAADNFHSTEGIRKVAYFLGSINTLSQARGVECGDKKNELISYINQFFGNQEKVSIDIMSSNIGELTSLIEKIIFDEVIESAIKIANSHFTKEDVLRLTGKIKDISPIYTILARFIGKNEWNAAIDYFLLLLHSINNGEYTDIKYGKKVLNESDKRIIEQQLDGFTLNQRRLWEENEFSLNIIGVEGDSMDQIHQQIHQQIYEIIHHLGLDQNIGSINEDTRITIETFINAKDKDIIKLTKEFYESNFNTILGKIVILISQENNIEIIRKVFAKIKSLKDFFLKDPFIKSRSDNISTILSGLKPKDSDIIFTTEIDNPYTIFTLTQLMKLSSCLNYTNGTELQALISYSIDSNVKLVSSFVIKASDFQNRRDYLAFIDTIQNKGDGFQCSFDPGKYELIYGINGKFLTIPVSNIVFRQFIKLGINTDNLGCVGLEPGMIQVYPSIEKVKTIVTGLINTKLSKLGLSESNVVNMPQSRSPLGSYSDINHGRHLGPYIMQY